MKIKALHCSVIILLFVFLVSFILYAEVVSDIEESMLKGNYSESITSCKRLLNRRLTFLEKRHIHYLMGLSYLKLGNTQEAIREFQRAISKSKDSITINSLVGIADAYFLDEDFYKAIDKYQYILSDYSSISNKGNIYYKLARSYLKAGNWHNSKTYFKKVKRNYPLSFEGLLAKDILKENVFYFTIQVGSFANRDNAKKLYYRLKKQNFPVYIDKKEINQRTFYRVRVGKFNTNNKVLSMGKKLERAGLPTKIYP